MFKKSLQILGACALLTLGVIVAYALLKLRGPDDLLYEAERSVQQGAYGEAIKVLNLAEPSASVQSDAEAQSRLWRLRYTAQERLGNTRAALQDVRNLLQHGFADEIDLRLEEVRLLAADGQGDRARQAALAFLEQHPEHARGLELAGEACQTAYQPLLIALSSDIEGEVGKPARRVARTHLLGYLYRPDGDPHVAIAQGRLHELFSGEARLVGKWPLIWQRAQDLRERIQQGLGFFRKSLDGGDEPVAAFRAVATALEQSGRTDDLLFTCEIQRRRFDHAYVLESGERAAWALLQARLAPAAMATVDRWLTPEGVAERAAARTLTATAEQLALARAVGAWQARQLPELATCRKLVAALREHDLTSAMALHVRLAAQRLMQKKRDPEQTAKSLRAVVRRAARQPAPVGGVDLVAEFAPLWIDALQESGASEEELLESLQTWRESRTDRIAPHQRTAEYLLELGRTAAAFAALDDAEKILQDAPELFDLRLRISRRHYENSGISGPSLLSQCISNRSLTPETNDPIGYLLCAEEALSVNAPRANLIALASARKAVESFPRAILPRQLEMKAALVALDPIDAARTADRTLAAIEPDAELIALAIRARRQADLPLRDIVRLAMPRDSRSPELQVELIELALADAPRTAIRYVSDTMRKTPPTQRARALTVRALAASGNVDRARELLATAEPPADDSELAALQLALSSWLEAQSAASPDDQLLALAQPIRDRLLVGAGPRAATLETAEKLATTHPKTAFDLLQHALPDAQPDERNGARYVLAGELALVQHDFIQGANFWLAAIGFADGQQVAERLSRLLLLRGDAERAERVYQLATTPTDPALAARFGKLALALELLSKGLESEPADLLVHSMLSTFGQPSMIDWQQPEDEEVQRERLELLAGMRDANLGPLYLPRADAMLRGDPTRRIHYLLLARASADSGVAVAAGRLHAELFRNGLANPVLWREVAYAGQQPGYQTDEVLVQRILGATTNGKTAGSALTVAYGTKKILEGFERGGFDDMAQKTRIMLWRGAPQLLPYTERDLDLIAAEMPPVEACSVIDSILTGPHANSPIGAATGDQHEPLLRRFYALANALRKADAKAAEALIPTVVRHLQQEGARGDIVHFLLAYGDDERPVVAADLLKSQLRYVAAGGPADIWFDRSTALLIDEIGLEETVATFDELLDAHPTRLPLWSARSLLRTRLNEEEEAMQELRHVLTHARAARAELAFLALASSYQRLEPDDFAQFAKLPEAVRETRQGRYVAGMLALRLGDANAAIPLLADCQPQLDGRHLYALALAHLQGSNDNGPAAARALLEQLLGNYASSSLAQNAGSFVRQLAPR
ncbi:MAG: hypothetical protein AB8H80_21035 [Planctomycetota bacterium]